MPTKRKKLRPPKSIAQVIEEHYLNKVGATMVIDASPDSDEANYGTFYSWEKQTKVLTFFLENFSTEQKEYLHRIVRQEFESGELIAEKEYQESLLAYEEYADSNSDQDVLQFFAGFLSADDYEALKMSLYLRDEQKKGQNISKHKKDIREKFGDRGANIANLCTAGYFEDEFMPLYKSNKQDFNVYYESAVGKKARALFVHSLMGEDEIENEFNLMIAKARKYHMADFRIHGLGAINVTNIKKFFENRKKEENENFEVVKEIERAKPPSVEYSVTFQKGR